MPEIDYSKLRGRIVEKGLNQKQVAAEIGVNPSHFCRKLTGEYVFNQSEIRDMCRLLDIDSQLIGEYFFNPKVEKTQPI